MLSRQTVESSIQQWTSRFARCRVWRLASDPLCSLFVSRAVDADVAAAAAHLSLPCFTFATSLSLPHTYTAIISKMQSFLDPLPVTWSLASRSLLPLSSLPLSPCNSIREPFVALHAPLVAAACAFASADAALPLQQLSLSSHSRHLALSFNWRLV